MPDKCRDCKYCEWWKFDPSPPFCMALLEVPDIPDPDSVPSWCPLRKEKDNA